MSEIYISNRQSAYGGVFWFPRGPHPTRPHTCLVTISHPNNEKGNLCLLHERIIGMHMYGECPGKIDKLMDTQLRPEHVFINLQLIILQYVNMNNSCHSANSSQVMPCVMAC